MPFLEKIKTALNEIAPFELAAEWDNSGIMVDCDRDITAALVALDITDEVIQQAESLGCELIISHHPVIFHPLKRLTQHDIAYKLVQKNISAISAHTNLDAAQGGVNDVLAQMFGLVAPVPLHSFGRIGMLNSPVKFSDLCNLCAAHLGPNLRYVDSTKPIEVLAVVSGSVGDYVQRAKDAGADCLLTGEAAHHDALLAKELGMSLIVTGHFATEFPVVPVLAQKLSEKLPEIKFTPSQCEQDSFSYYMA